jgi:hypothetical protein
MLLKQQPLAPGAYMQKIFSNAACYDDKVNCTYQSTAACHRASVTLSISQGMRRNASVGHQWGLNTAGAATTAV